MWCSVSLRTPLAAAARSSATSSSSNSGRWSQRSLGHTQPRCPAVMAAAAAAERAAVPVCFKVGGQEVTVEAVPGQNLWEVANDAGADITLGCSQGSCGVCEVEVHKFSAGGAAPSCGVVRACIAGIPPGYERLEVHEVADEDFWGVDGYDT